MSSPTDLAECANCLKCGDLIQAQNICITEISRNPDDGRWHNLLGLIYCECIRSGDTYPEAAAHTLNAFYRAIRSPNSLPQFYLNLAKCWGAVLQPQRAIAVIQEAEARFGSVFELDQYKATLLGICLQGKAVMEICERYIEQDSNNIKLWVRYCESIYAAGDLRAALAVFDAACSKFPAILSRIGSDFDYAKLLMAVGRLSEAKTIMDQRIASGITESVRIERRLSILEGDRCYSAAEELWSQLIELEPSSAERWLGLANNLARQGRYKESLAAIDTATFLLGQSPEAARTSAKMESIRRAITSYIPRILQFSAVEPSLPRAPSKDVIVIRGGVDAYNIDIIKHFRAAHEGKNIILSTWSDTDENKLKLLRPYVDDLVLGVRPRSPGMYNINYQVTCAANGTRRAKEIGAERILLVRTDIALLKQGLLSEFSTTLEDHKPQKEIVPGLKRRIIISEIFTAVPRLYHASDIFCYGATEDIVNYWSDEDLEETCLRPEVYLLRRFAKKIGRTLKNDANDCMAAFRDIFIIRDADSLHFFWQKHPDISSDSVSKSLTTFFDEKAWGSKEFQTFIKAQELPRKIYVPDLHR